MTQTGNKALFQSLGLSLCLGLAALAGVPALGETAPPGALAASDPSLPEPPAGPEAKGGPLRRDCPNLAADEAQNSAPAALQIREAIQRAWAFGRVPPEMAGASALVRLCPGSDPRHPLDVFIMEYDGPEGAGQEAMIGSLMTAIRRVVTSGPGFQSAVTELGKGDPDLVTLDLRFTLPPADETGSGAAP